MTAAISSLVTLAAWFRNTRTGLCAVTVSLATFTPVFGQPVITQQPQNQTNVAGTTATFTVGATGTEPLSYRWRFNDAYLAEKTNRTFSLANVQMTNAGNYTLIVTMAFGA